MNTPPTTPDPTPGAPTDTTSLQVGQPVRFTRRWRTLDMPGGPDAPEGYETIIEVLDGNLGAQVRMPFSIIGGGGVSQFVPVSVLEAIT